jgi:hypothetical protein
MKGIFLGMSENDLLTALEAARAQAKTGQTKVSWSAAGISVGKAQNMPPGEVILEIRYALQKLDPLAYGRDLITSRTTVTFL